MVREKGFDLVASEEEWLSLNVQEKTNLQIRCQTSGTIVDNVQIREFMRKKRFKCEDFAPQFKWNSKAGYERFNSMVANRNCSLEMTLEEWYEKVKG